MRRGYKLPLVDGPGKMVGICQCISARELPSSPGPTAFLRRQDNASKDEPLARALHEDVCLLLADVLKTTRETKLEVRYGTTRPRGRPMRCTWYVSITWGA